MTPRRLLAAAFFSVLFFIAIRDFVDPDIWWHLKTGSVILERGIPHQDIFSYTMPGKPWVAHEWLSEVFLWLIFRAAGIPGLIVLTALFAVLTFLCLYLVFERRYSPAVLPVILISFGACFIGWHCGPKLFTYLLAALFLLILEKIKSGELSERWLWFLPPLSFLWVNLHGGYVLGLAIIAFYALGEFFEKSARAKTLVRVGLVAGVVTLANPQGPKIWMFPFGILLEPGYARHIMEWCSPDFHAISVAPFLIYIIFVIITLTFGRRKPTFTEAVIFVFTFPAALWAIRNIPVFSILNAPFLIRQIDAWIGEKREAIGSGKGNLLFNFLNLAAAVMAVGFLLPARLADAEAAIPKKFPVKAVEYLKREGLDKKRAYNDYGFGGYLIWKDIPVMIDGRVDMYGAAFLDEYSEGPDVFSKYRIDYAILHKDRPLASLLTVMPRWREIYRDETSRIFVKRW